MDNTTQEYFQRFKNGQDDILSHAPEGHRKLIETVIKQKYNGMIKDGKLADGEPVSLSSRDGDAFLVTSDGKGGINIKDDTWERTERAVLGGPEIKEGKLENEDRKPRYDISRMTNGPLSLANEKHPLHEQYKEWIKLGDKKSYMKELSNGTTILVSGDDRESDNMRAAFTTGQKMPGETLTSTKEWQDMHRGAGASNLMRQPLFDKDGHLDLNGDGVGGFRGLIKSIAEHFLKGEGVRMASNGQFDPKLDDGTAFAISNKIVAVDPATGKPPLPGAPDLDINDPRMVMTGPANTGMKPV